nr:ABC transporter permease [uncultured Blautia sp.]
MKKAKKIDGNILRLLAIFVIILAVSGITKGTSFLNVGNLQSMAKTLTEYGLMAVGCGITMISGGIDLSTVYIANLCGILAGLTMNESSSSIVLAIIVALVVGALCGIFNGFLVSVLKIPAMLATLGTYQLYMGIAVVASKGSTVSGVTSFSSFAYMTVAGIPMPFIVFVLMIVVISFIMGKTKFGKRVHLVGTNEKASKFAGINTVSVLIRAYMLSGIVSAVAGLLSLSRINSAKADFGSSYTMQTILISVLGGINPDGGFGSIPGVAIAVLILQMLSSYLNMFPNISNYYRDLIWGVALIAVLIMNFTIEKRRMAKLSQK